MKRRTFMKRAAAGTAAGVLAGCGGDKLTSADICDQPQEYQQARSIPSLRVPEGLDPPDRSGVLVIPDEDKAGQYPDGRPCLDRPPDYFGR